MIQFSHSTDTDNLNRFAPKRFSIDPSGADPLVEAIPVNEIIMGRDRMAGRFSIVPLAAVHFFPPAARVLLMLAYAQRFYSPDIDGGWYRLRTGIATDFHLHDKDVRRHALAALEKARVIEVLRYPGKSPCLRLSPDHAAEFQYAPRSRRKRGAVRMRTREIGESGATTAFVDC